MQCDRLGTRLLELLLHLLQRGGDRGGRCRRLRRRCGSRRRCARFGARRGRARRLRYRRGRWRCHGRRSSAHDVIAVFVRDGWSRCRRRRRWWRWRRSRRWAWRGYGRIEPIEEGIVCLWRVLFVDEALVRGPCIPHWSEQPLPARRERVAAARAAGQDGVAAREAGCRGAVAARGAAGGHGGGTAGEAITERRATAPHPAVPPAPERHERGESEATDG